MAKQRNSLGVLVLPTGTNNNTLSWSQYKEKYGIDLNEIFGWTEDFGSVFIKPSFSKFIALDWRPVINQFNYNAIERSPIELIFALSSQGVVGGDYDEVITFSTNVVYFQIDAKNKTVLGGEY